MEHGCMCTSLGRDSPSHSFSVQEGGKEPLFSVCRGGGQLWSLHPTATSQGWGRGEDHCQAAQTQKKSLIAQTQARAVFFPFRLWAGRHSRFKWQETRNGRRPADPSGENHPHPVAMGFCSREELSTCLNHVFVC